MRLEFTERAVCDLIRLREFLAQHDPEAAQRVAEQLIAAAQKLSDTPNIGRWIERIPSMREWVVGRYVIRYQVVDDALIVARIWHGREDRH